MRKIFFVLAASCALIAPAEATPAPVDLMDGAVPPWDWSYAVGVNGQGHVAGQTHMIDVRLSFLWTPQDIRFVGSGVEYTRPVAVTDVGQLVGSIATPETGHRWRGFSWTRDGRLSLFGAAGVDTHVRAANGSGMVVGRTGDRAFVWTEAEGLLELGTLGGSPAEAVSLNDRGEVIGWATLADGRRRAFLWTRSSGTHDLGTLGGDSSEAIAVNRYGHVVGTSQLPTGEWRAFLWTKAEGMIALGTLGGDSLALAISDCGQVVGYGHVPDAEYHPFSWTRASGMEDLGFEGAALEVSSTGLVIGHRLVNGTLAFGWTRAGGTVDLGLLPGGTSSDVAGLNSSGQVVGWSAAVKTYWDETYYVRQRAALWNVPTVVITTASIRHREHSTLAEVKLTTGLGMPLPTRGDDVVAVWVDGVTVLSVPFSTFTKGTEPGAYTYNGKDRVIAHLDFTSRSLTVKAPVDGGTLHASGDLQVDVAIGDSIATDRVTLTTDKGHSDHFSYSR